MLIREAAAADWAAIWPFFRQITAAGDTFSYPTDLTAEQGRDLWMTAPPGRTVVAVDDQGAVLGTGNMYSNRAGNGSHVASASYMVDPAHAGKGVGRALCEHSLGWARENGYRMMQYNAVVETNVHAVQLYRSLGFSILGTLPEGFRHPTRGYVGLHSMYCVL